MPGDDATLGVVILSSPHSRIHSTWTPRRLKYRTHPPPDPFFCVDCNGSGEEPCHSPSHPPILISSGVENVTGVGKKRGVGEVGAVEDELKGGGKYQDE